MRRKSISYCVLLLVTLSADVITAGASAGLSDGERDARTTGKLEIGMVVFVIAKGGPTFKAAIGGQKFGCTAV